MIRISSKNLIIQFCHAERLKSAVLNMMQIFLKYQDYLEHRRETPDGKTVLSWFMNALHNDIARATNVSHSKNLIDAQELVSKVLLDTTGSIPNFQNLLDILRASITKITTEASSVAKQLDF